MFDPIGEFRFVNSFVAEPPATDTLLSATLLFCVLVPAPDAPLLVLPPEAPPDEPLLLPPVVPLLPVILLPDC